MFRSKSRTEELTEHVHDQSESLADAAAAMADQLRERVGPAVGQATENAREWARPRFEHGVEVAAPRLESAVIGLAPRVDTARDKIVDELIPRLAEAISVWAAATVAARDEVVTRGQGAASVMSGGSVATPKGGRKRRVLLIVGLLGGAAAAAMAVMRKSAPKDDPWMTPLEDRYEATPNGRHSTPSPVKKATVAATETKTEVADSPDAPVAGTPVSLARDIDPSGQDRLDKDLPDAGADKDDVKKSSKNDSEKNAHG